MSDFSYYFLDPCELVAIVYGSDRITELGRYSFQGYMRGMNHFFQICSLLAREVAHSQCSRDAETNNFIDILRDYYPDVKSGKVDSLESALQRHINDLKQYKFKSQRIFPTLPQSSATSLNRRRFEITIDRIFKWIQKMRRYRIIFYERILQEYKTRKDQYNHRLRINLESEGKNYNKESEYFTIESVLDDLDVESEKDSNASFPDNYYEIRCKSWYLADLAKLKNPEIERYTKKYTELPRYRVGEIHTHPEGLIAFFELFFVFKDEMSFILPDDPDKSFFERVLTVLRRDFFNEFEQQGDLEEIIVKHIEELEKYEFLSLPKEQFYDKLSKMIYRLRTRRIVFYEAVLEDYLANKEAYDNAM